MKKQLFLSLLIISFIANHDSKAMAVLEICMRRKVIEQAPGTAMVFLIPIRHSLSQS